MGSAPTTLGEQASPARAESAAGVIIVPTVLRPILLVANFAAQAVPLWMMYSMGLAWPVFIMGGLLLGLVPALDHMLGGKRFDFDRTISDANYRRLLLLQALFLLLTMSGSVAVAASGKVPLWAGILAVVTVGIINVHIPVVAHDFGHKIDRWNRTISNAICAIGGLGYFMPQHVMGHHVQVATPEDCASARFGQSSFEFIVKCFVPEVKGGIRLEAERLRKRGLPVWSLHNDVIVGYLFTVLLAAALVALFGWIALPLVLLHHASVWFSLMLNDYIQHYGLQRELLPNGKREPQGPLHSWSADAPLCNLMVFNVQRHANHHARPMQSYQELVALEEGAICPTGYFGMMVLALVPPWWHHVMDPLVVHYADGKRSRVNVDPKGERRLQKLLDAYTAG
jgi:alkane 1-monooxygenase